MIESDAIMADRPVRVARLEGLDPSGDLEELACAVSWGDGTAATAGVVRLAATGADVYAAHGYTQPGRYVVSVQVVGPNGNRLHASSLAIVGDARERALVTLHQRLLGRPVSRRTLSRLLARLRAGVGMQDIARGLVAASYRERAIERAYTTLLGRMPSAGEKQRWQRRRKLSADAVAVELTATREFREGPCGGPPERLAERIYHAILGRSATASEVNAAVAGLADSGAWRALAARLLATAEARLRTVDRVFRHVAGRAPTGGDLGRYLDAHQSSDEAPDVAADVIAGWPIDEPLYTVVPSNDPAERPGEDMPDFAFQVALPAALFPDAKVEAVKARQAAVFMAQFGAAPIVRHHRTANQVIIGVWRTSSADEAPRTAWLTRMGSVIGIASTVPFAPVGIFSARKLMQAGADLALSQPAVANPAPGVHVTSVEITFSPLEKQVVTRARGHKDLVSLGSLTLGTIDLTATLTETLSLELIVPPAQTPPRPDYHAVACTEKQSTDADWLDFVGGVLLLAAMPFAIPKAVADAVSAIGASAQTGPGCALASQLPETELDVDGTLLRKAIFDFKDIVFGEDYVIARALPLPVPREAKLTIEGPSNVWLARFGPSDIPRFVIRASDMRPDEATGELTIGLAPGKMHVTAMTQVPRRLHDGNTHTDVRITVKFHTAGLKPGEKVVRMLQVTVTDADNVTLTVQKNVQVWYVDRLDPPKSPERPKRQGLWGP